MDGYRSIEVPVDASKPVELNFDLQPITSEPPPATATPRSHASYRRSLSMRLQEYIAEPSADKALVIADLARRVGDDGIAAAYYRVVVKERPGTQAAIRAQRQLDRIAARTRDAPANPSSKLVNPFPASTER
jgi:hypothetical protein